MSEGQSPGKGFCSKKKISVQNDGRLRQKSAIRTIERDQRWTGKWSNATLSIRLTESNMPGMLWRNPKWCLVTNYAGETASLPFLVEDPRRAFSTPSCSSNSLEESNPVTQHPHHNFQWSFLFFYIQLSSDWIYRFHPHLTIRSHYLVRGLVTGSHDFGVGRTCLLFVYFA